MTLSDFASLSTAVSGVAVTISLIYLGIQTRQNVRHTRALIHQGATARTTSIMLANQNRDSSAAWVQENGNEATPEAIRKMQFNLMAGTLINAMEDFYFQKKDGLIDNELFERNCDMFRGLLSEPGMRAYWIERRDGGIAKASPNFTKFVDGLCTEPASTFKYRV